MDPSFDRMALAQTDVLILGGQGYSLIGFDGGTLASFGTVPREVDEEEPRPNPMAPQEDLAGTLN